MTELKATKCTFQRCVDCLDIAKHSSARGIKQRWDGKNKPSSTHGCHALTWR